MKRALSLYFFFALSCGMLVAQSSDWQLRIYGFEEGLSHRNVFRVQQDSSGFLWIATVNGLNRYDGYEFTHYNQQTTPGLLAQDVVAELYCDADNLLWLGHPNYLTHLLHHQTTSDTMVINNQSLARGAEQTPSYIQVDEVGNIWLVAFAEQQGRAFLQCFDPGGELLFEKQLDGRYEKHPMLVYDNVVYVNGAPHEIWQLDLEDGGFETFSFPYNSKDADAARIVEMQNDREGNLIVLLANGEVYTKAIADSRFRQHPITASLVDTDEFETFYYDEKGNFWLASENGLILYEEQTNSWWDFHANIRELIRHDLSYRQIFVDASEVVWVASDFGLIKLVQQNEFFRTYLTGGNSYCSSGFCSMRGITEDPSGNLYFAYYNAIHQLDATSGAIRPLFPDNEYVGAPFGLLWHNNALLTGNGLRIDLITYAVDTLFRSSLEDKGHPVADEMGNVWIGCEQSLYYMSATDALPKKFVDQQGLLDSFPYEITHLHPGARSGYLWISTCRWRGLPPGSEYWFTPAF
jgi:ligand-binding sensor domain-containing protein